MFPKRVSPPERTSNVPLRVSPAPSPISSPISSPKVQTRRPHAPRSPGIGAPISPGGLGSMEEDAPLLSHDDSDGDRRRNDDSDSEADDHQPLLRRGGGRARARDEESIWTRIRDGVTISLLLLVSLVSRPFRKLYTIGILRTLFWVFMVFAGIMFFFTMFATPWREESYPLSGDPAPKSFPENGVRFVAYNFYQRPPPVQSFPATDHKEDRLRDFIHGVEDSGSFLDKFDIYAFSEMFGAYNSRRDRLVSAAKEHGLLYAAHGPERNWWKGRIVDSGLLVLSRYPIASVKRLQYEGGTDSDRAAAKGILYTQILLSPKARLHLFLSHLQSSYVPDDQDDGDNLDEKGTVIRHSEFHVFRKFILRTLRQASRDGSNYTDDAVVLAGDFNVNGARFGWQPKVDGLEYLRMMRIFRGQDEDGEDEDDVKNVVIDVLKASAGEHPETWGQWEACLKGNSFGDSVRQQNVDTVGQKAEAVGEPLYGVNAESPIGKRLDYVLDWRLRREGTLRADVNATRALKFVVTETRVERFEVLNRPYSRLSDHMGVASLLKYD